MKCYNEDENPAIYGWRKMLVHSPDGPIVADVYQLEDGTLVFYQYPDTPASRVLRRQVMPAAVIPGVLTVVIDPYMFWGPPYVRGRQAQEAVEATEREYQVTEV